MKFTVIGFVLFFLFSTLKTRGEANWNIPILVPILWILFSYSIDRPKTRKLIYRLGGVTVLIFLLLRALLLLNIESLDIGIKNQFHGGKVWAEEISKLAKGKPVVFSNSYQNASKHWFYSKQETHSHNNAHYRRNQFDIWPIEDSLQGKTVLFVANWDRQEFQKSQTSKGTLKYAFIDNYRTYGTVEVQVPEME